MRLCLAMRYRTFIIAAVIAASAAWAQSPAPSRGVMLYQTHCIACHDTQVHWRERHLATDWSSLAAQVRRWQANTGQNWTDDDIDEVARYLNATIYRFPEEARKQRG